MGLVYEMDFKIYIFILLSLGAQPQEVFGQITLANPSHFLVQKMY